MRLFVLLLILIPIQVSTSSSAAQAGEPYALLEAVNQLRADNGQSPYQMNSSLMNNIDGSVSQPLQAGATATTLPTLEPFFGVQTVTPAPDGAVVHEVMPGQSLYAIAEAYAITLDELLELNNLTRESVIQPGDKLIIRAASSATPTLETTSSPTQPPPTSTQLPTRTPTLRPSASPTSVEMPLSSATPAQAPAQAGDRIGDALLAAVLLLAVVGVVLVVIGFVLKRRN